MDRCVLLKLAKSSRIRRWLDFTDVEEGQVGLTDKVPFLLETRMKELGAVVQNKDPWSDNAVRDGNLVTGQNPQSSVSVAKLCLA
jgi:putative intracellular protease/amidase